MHIELWKENKEKALSMSRALGAPNRYINDFLSNIEQDNFVSSMQELLRSDHVRIRIVVERVITDEVNK
jgi:hypothetical protein